VQELDPRRAWTFGARAEEYERWRPSYPPDAVAWLVPPGAARVADVGAGTGKLTGPLLALGLEVVAIEPDPAMLAVLRREHPAAVPYLAGAGALPIPDASVDAVLAGQAWHWFTHEQTAAEVRRVLRPGGWLGLVWNGPDPRDIWEYDLARLDPDTAGRDFLAEPAGEPFQVDGLPPDELEWARFGWVRETDGTSLAGRLRTHSGFVVMPPEDRERLIAAMVAVVTAEAQRRDTPTLPLRQSAHCVRWRPSPGR
jgi:SAM-dependent methyltransferase